MNPLSGRFARPIRLAVALFWAVLGTTATGTAVSGAETSPQNSQPAAPPNILFCIADDWGLHAGCYGTRWVQTPAFDRVAREGILFERAYTPNAKCAPSRACLLTGRNSWQLEAAANHICWFPPQFLGWGEVLAQRGWHVGYTTKGWGPGIAEDASGQPRQMTGTAWNRRKLTPPAAHISNNDYAANFRDFLDQASAERPWCFWFGAIEPHRAYEFGAGVAKGGKQLTDIDRVPAYWPDTEGVRHDMLDYAFEVEHFDSHVGQMLAELEQRGQLDNTLVIVTSDHAMPFPRCKGNTGETSNHVPLAMMWPQGIAHPGRRIQDFVSFVDIAPTFLQLAGIQQADSGMQPFAGRSLVPILQSEQHGQTDPQRDFVLIGRERNDVGRPHDEGFPVRGIVTADWLLLENFEPARWPAGNPETGYLDCDAGVTKSLILRQHRMNPDDPFWALCFGFRPSLELYRLSTDPDCVQNLADDPAFADQQTALRKRLHQALREQQDPRMLGNGSVFDRYPHASQAHAGFYERFLNGEKVRAGWIDPTDIEPLPPESLRKQN